MQMVILLYVDTTQAAIQLLKNNSSGNKFVFAALEQYGTGLRGRAGCSSSLEYVEINLASPVMQGVNYSKNACITSKVEQPSSGHVTPLLEALSLMAAESIEGMP